MAQHRAHPCRDHFLKIANAENPDYVDGGHLKRAILEGRGVRLSFLWRMLGRERQTALSHVHILMYTRRGCHLCDSAWAELQRAQSIYQFALTAVDVDGNAALAATYGDQVPVVLIDSKVRFQGGVNTILLNRLLHAECRKARARRSRAPL
jgi:hypothetical protein